MWRSPRTSGGNFEALTTTSTATTTVTDDADATTVTFAASAGTVGEGGSVTYTASVNNAGDGFGPGGDLEQRSDDHDPGGPIERRQRAYAVRADDAYVQGTRTLSVAIASHQWAGTSRR